MFFLDKHIHQVVHAGAGPGLLGIIWLWLPAYGMQVDKIKHLHGMSSITQEYGAGVRRAWHTVVCEVIRMGGSEGEICLALLLTGWNNS